MTSVCQPCDGRNAGRERKGVRGGVEMERGESGGDVGGGWGGGGKQPCESTSSAYKGLAFTKVSPEAPSCHEGKLTTAESC